MSWGLAALSGLLGGLPGLPKGMNEGMQFDQRQQQIDLQRRQFEEGRSTDTSSIGIPGRTPNALIPYLASLAKTKEETARKGALGQGLADQVLAAGTTTGMAPGASVEMPQPGAMLAPPPSTPMPPMTQKTVRPEMAALAKFLPQLAQLDPAGVSKQVMEQFATPKPQIVGKDARGIFQGGKLEEFSPRPEPPLPPGMLPKRATVGGVTYETPGDPKEGPQPTVGGDVVRTLDALDAARASGNIAEVKRLEKRLDTLRSHALAPGGVLVGGATGTTLATGPPQTQSLPVGSAETLAEGDMALRMMDQIGSLHQTKFTGALQGRVGALKQATIGTSDQETDFRATIQALENQLLRARSGLAVTPQEYERIKKELPQANDPDNVFSRKLATARDLLAKALETRRAEYTQRGFRGGDPTRPAANPPATPKGETLSRRDERYQQLRQRGLTDQQIQQQFGVTVTD